MTIREQGQHTGSPLRHIPYVYSDLAAFGDHYVTQDPSLNTAGHFDVTVFPRGDNRRPASDPLRTTPHIRVRTWAPGCDATPLDACGNGCGWKVASVTPIGKHG